MVGAGFNRGGQSLHWWGPTLTPSSVLPGGHASQQQVSYLPQAVTCPSGTSQHLLSSPGTFPARLPQLIDTSSRGHTLPVLVPAGDGVGSGGTVLHSLQPGVSGGLGALSPPTPSELPLQWGTPASPREASAAATGGTGRGAKNPWAWRRLLAQHQFAGRTPCQQCRGLIILPPSPQQLPDAFSNDNGGDASPFPALAAPVEGDRSFTGIPWGVLHWVWGLWCGGKGFFAGGVVTGVLADLPPLCNLTQSFIAAGWGSTWRGMQLINYRGGRSWAGAQHGFGGELHGSGNPYIQALVWGSLRLQLPPSMVGLCPPHQRVLALS